MFFVNLGLKQDTFLRGGSRYIFWDFFVLLQRHTVRGNTNILRTVRDQYTSKTYVLLSFQSDAVTR